MNDYYKTLTAIILSFLLNTCLFSQDRLDYVADVQHFTVEDGLSYRKVNTVFQDSRGFIWMGTEHGLNRFDGHDWISLSKELNGLSHNTVQQIEEDDEGWLWIITESQIGINTISFVHTLTLEVQTFEERFKDSNIRLDDVISVLSAKNQSIYISQQNKILHYQKGKWNTIPVEGLGYFKLCDISPNGDWIGFQSQNRSIYLTTINKKGQWKQIL